MQHYGPAVAAQPQLCQQIFLLKYYKLFDCMLDEKFPAGCRAQYCVLCEEHEVRCTECSPEHKTSNSNLSPYSPTLQGTISHLNVIKVSLYKDWYYTLTPILGNTLNKKVKCKILWGGYWMMIFCRVRWLHHCSTLDRGGERPLLCHCVVVLQQVGDHHSVVSDTPQRKVGMMLVTQN